MFNARGGSQWGAPPSDPPPAQNPQAPPQSPTALNMLEEALRQAQADNLSPAMAMQQAIRGGMKPLELIAAMRQMQGQGKPYSTNRQLPPLPVIGNPWG